MAAAGKWGVEKCLDDARGDVGRREPLAERQHVGVVVLATEAGGGFVGRGDGANPGNLVRRDRHADPGAADEDAVIKPAIRDFGRDPGREIRIVHRVGRLRAEVLVRDAALVKNAAHLLFQLDARVIRAKRDAHGGKYSAALLVYDAAMSAGPQALGSSSAADRPTVIVSPRGVERLRNGHPWIYRSDVREADVEAGAIVRVGTGRGRPLGLALWSSSSQIALRFLGAEELGDDRAWIGARLDAALAFRGTLAIDGTAWRAVNAEADRLPGLIVDVYGEGHARHLVIQTLSQGMDRRRTVIVELLAERLAPAGILARNDPRVRQLEGLNEEITVEYGDVAGPVEVREGPLTFDVDLREGQKTGLFLDQRENHEVAGHYARGRGLDAFSYHGGFALRMAGRCTEVLALDSSAAAVAQIAKNAARNGIRNVTAREANVFDELRELEVALERFDTIVLDPPAFAKNRASVERAAAGYKEINLRALKLLAPGGCLMTCSCSYNIEPALFHAILEGAAADARAVVSVLETRAQSRDHPILLNVPETHYLKCLVLRKLG